MSIFCHLDDNVLYFLATGREVWTARALRSTAAEGLVRRCPTIGATLRRGGLGGLGRSGDDGGTNRP